MSSIFSRVLEILSDQAVATILGTIATIVGLIGSAYGLYRWMKERRKAKLARQHRATAWRTEFDRNVDAGELEAAYSLASAIADPASGHSDRSIRRAVHLKTIEALDFEFSNAEDDRRSQILDRMREHIDALRKLGEPRHLLFALQARLAHLERNPNLAIELAMKSLKHARQADDRMDALVTILEALRQIGDFDRALSFGNQVEHLVATDADQNNRLILRAAWLKILVLARKASASDVEAFVDNLRAARSSSEFRPKHILQAIDYLAQVLNEGGDTRSCIVLLGTAFELARSDGRPLMAATIANQLSELTAATGDQSGAEKHLASGNEEVERLRNSGDADIRGQWASARVNALMASGRVHSRLASLAEAAGERTEPHLEKAKAAFELAEQFARSNEPQIRGDVGAFYLDLGLQLSGTLFKLGLYLAAADCLRRTRPGIGRPDSQWFRRRLFDSSVCEAESVLLGGDAPKAISILERLPPVDAEHARQASLLHEYISDRVLPISNWLESADAQLISNRVARDGLRPVVAAHTGPLVEWWREFHSAREDIHSAHSEILDVWGRGGLARVIASIRASPLSAIAVDATTTDEIARWVRLFCPLYDVVVVKWKGAVHGAMGIIPMPPNVGGDTTGGQGYEVTSSMDSSTGWPVAMGWANFVPREISSFLANDALPLIKAGRLVFLPAPTVGCTQSSVGWTDNMLMDDLLGGVVNVVGRGRAVDENGSPARRVHDLSQISVPFIDGIPLRDLNSVLDETAEWIGPLRKLLRGSIGSAELRRENWQSLSPVLDDLREATRELNGRLASLVARAGSSDWSVAEAISAISAGPTSQVCPGTEPCTGLLRAVAAGRPDLAPWVPYWRMQEAGGEVNWAGSLDNRSREPDEEQRRVLAARGVTTPISQSWLYPGSGSPGMRVAIRI
jgi:tetratricopeptide (TPR) repeat protein